MNHTIALFIKIGKEKYIKDLYENGTVFMSTLEHFRSIEDEFLRGDPNEGAACLVDSNKATMKIPSLGYEGNPINIRYGNFLKTGNIYSLYCLSSYGFPTPEGFTMDKRNLDFGSHALIIKKPGKFIEQVAKALDERSLYHEHGFVNYYKNQDRLSDLTAFDKSDLFEHQKEFRFFVENDVLETISLNIGSMKPYSEMCETKDLSSLRVGA